MSPDSFLSSIFWSKSGDLVRVMSDSRSFSISLRIVSSCSTEAEMQKKPNLNGLERSKHSKAVEETAPMRKAKRMRSCVSSRNLSVSWSVSIMKQERMEMPRDEMTAQWIVGNSLCREVSRLDRCMFRSVRRVITEPTSVASTSPSMRYMYLRSVCSSLSEAHSAFTSSTGLFSATMRVLYLYSNDSTFRLCCGVALRHMCMRVECMARKEHASLLMHSRITDCRSRKADIVPATSVASVMDIVGTTMPFTAGARISALYWPPSTTAQFFAPRYRNASCAAPASGSNSRKPKKGAMKGMKYRRYPFSRTMSFLLYSSSRIA
mmetsp:Transcript_21234/g.47157  ORF Transcript_21234/g.47157 Transcript_21234/m.47157 type:complete len:321 (+) Transcript_21234:142-1104(+)